MSAGRHNPSISLIDTIGVHSGLQHYDNSLSTVLEKAGFLVDVVSNFSPAGMKPKSSPILRNFYRGGVFQKLWQLCGSYIAYLAHLIPRLFLVHHWWIYSSYGLRSIDFLFMLPLFLARKRLIIVIHDVFSITSQEGAISRWMKVIFYRMAPRYIILHSSETRRVLESSGYKGIFFETPTFPTANSIEVSQSHLGLDVRSAVDQGDRILLLMFGSLRSSKGLDTALAALRALPPEFSQCFHLIVAGRDSNNLLGSPGYEIGPELSVTILDRFVTDNEQAFLFQRCKLLLLPYREIYQSGVIEVAITYRVPVLASNLATFREFFFRYPSFGFIYGENAIELSHCLLSFAEKPCQLDHSYTDEDLQAHLLSVDRTDFVIALRDLATSNVTKV